MKIYRSVWRWMSFFTALNFILSCSLMKPFIPLDSQNVIEERGIWLHRNDLLLPKKEVLSFLDNLKNTHFTSVYIQTYFRGSVIYPESRFLPQFQDMLDSDILSWIIPEIKKRGMRTEAWIEYGFYAFHVPNASKTTERGVFLSLHPELYAIDSEGIPYIHNNKWGDFFSLCPANPKSHELLANVCLETLIRYPFDGINLDRIRFPSDRFCFCDFCKENFKKDTGLEIKPFPRDSLEYKMFVKWRNDKISRFLEVYAPQFRKVKHGITVSLAALPPDMMESHSQPWNFWLEKGYLDAAMPMLYGEQDFETRVKTISTFPRQDRIFCALDTDGLEPAKILEQIRYLKKNGAEGFALWYSSTIKDDLPILQSGLFARSAVSPLDEKGFVSNDLR